MLSIPFKMWTSNFLFCILHLLKFFHLNISHFYLTLFFIACCSCFNGAHCSCILLSRAKSFSKIETTRLQNRHFNLGSNCTLHCVCGGVVPQIQVGTIWSTLPLHPWGGPGGPAVADGTQLQSICICFAFGEPSRAFAAFLHFFVKTFFSPIEVTVVWILRNGMRKCADHTLTCDGTFPADSESS